MRKDTQTFLATVLGIPFVLSTAWGFHTMNEASTLVYERAPHEVSVPVEPVKAEAPAPVIPKKVPAIVPTPAPTPTPTPAPTPPVIVIQPEPVAPKPVPSPPKKSRRTRAS